MNNNKRRYNSTAPEVIEHAIKLISNGEISINKCAQKFKISKGTLINRIKKQHTKQVGRPTALSTEEEKVITNALVAVSKWGFPFDSKAIRHFVKTYLDISNQKKKVFSTTNNLPGKDWLHGFMLRNKKHLRMRFCQNLKLSKAKLTNEYISDYFQRLKESLTGLNGQFISSERVFNYDETNLTDDPGVRKFIFKKGVKYPERVMDSTKSSISIMFCGSAEGTLLPPYVVYQSAHLWNTWIHGGPNGTRYNRSKSGWFDAKCFKDWFFELFIPATRRFNDEVVLIGDNLSSHFSVEVIEAAAKNKIRFVCLPTNATHLCHPLDVAFYGPLKRQWRSILENYKTNSRKNSQTITKENFSSLLKNLVEALVDGNNKSENIVSGFAKCGILLFNPSKVLDRIPKVPEQGIDEVQVSVSSAVIEVLKNMRHGNENTTPKRKKSKMNIIPGKSICIEDFDAPSTSVLVEENSHTETVAGNFLAPSTSVLVEENSDIEQNLDSTNEEDDGDDDFTVEELMKLVMDEN